MLKIYSQVKESNRKKSSINKKMTLVITLVLRYKKRQCKFVYTQKKDHVTGNEQFIFHQG